MRLSIGVVRGDLRLIKVMQFEIRHGWGQKSSPSVRGGGRRVGGPLFVLELELKLKLKLKLKHEHEHEHELELEDGPCNWSEVAFNGLFAL